MVGQQLGLVELLSRATVHRAVLLLHTTHEEQAMSLHTDSGPVDRTRINMNEPYELRYWSKELGVSTAQLKSVVKKVGDGTDALRRAQPLWCRLFAR
jgi:hypothetical protein